jgi:hypothetical protein
MRSEITFDPWVKCETAFSMEAAATEALRGSIHNFATGILAKGFVLR